MPNSEHHHSSNIFQSHFVRSVFLGQAHPDLSQNLPAHGFVPSDPLAQPPGGARLGAQRGQSELKPVPPRRAPVPRGGESPALARPGGRHTPNLQRVDPGAVRAHEHLSVSNRERVLHEGEGVLHAQRDIQPTRVPRGDIGRPLRGVWQDKDRSASDHRDSSQPAVVTKRTRSRVTSRKPARAKKHNTDQRRRVPVQVWVAPSVKAELSRMAEQDGLSLSATGGAFLERALQQNIDLQYGALLQPIITAAIAREMRGIATRLAWLLVRVAFDCGQTRGLVTNILGRQPGMNQDLLKTILAESGKTAKANITQRTPQITELITAVEHWLT